jgi:hypothetical protein
MKLTLGKPERTDDDRAYIRINKIWDLRIVKTDEGVVLDLFAYGANGESLATTYAFDSEAKDENA